MFRRPGFELVAVVGLVLAAIAATTWVQSYVFTSGNGLPVDFPLTCEKCGNHTLQFEGDEFRCGTCGHLRWTRTR